MITRSGLTGVNGGGGRIRVRFRKRCLLLDKVSNVGRMGQQQPIFRVAGKKNLEELTKPLGGTNENSGCGKLSNKSDTGYNASNDQHHRHTQKALSKHNPEGYDGLEGIFNPMYYEAGGPF